MTIKNGMVAGAYSVENIVILKLLGFHANMVNMNELVHILFKKIIMYYNLMNTLYCSNHS